MEGSESLWWSCLKIKMLDFKLRTQSNISCKAWSDMQSDVRIEVKFQSTYFTHEIAIGNVKKRNFLIFFLSFYFPL